MQLFSLKRSFSAIPHPSRMTKASLFWARMVLMETSTMLGLPSTVDERNLLNPSSSITIASHRSRQFPQTKDPSRAEPFC